MSAPVMLACAATAVCLGLPVLSAAASVEAQHRASAAADAAALAAADAVGGWIGGEPCELATEVAVSAGTELVSCDLDAVSVAASVSVRAGAPLGSVMGRAKAGLDAVAAGPDGEVGANGWAWPSSVRGVTQSFHDGYSIDLAVGAGGELFAPYDGVVVQVGADGGGVPGVCVTNPSWWRGPNQSVVLKHEFQGRVLYSSHNHIAAGSAQAFGVSVGDRVRAGQRVATAGMSGCTSGLHTHFTLASNPTNAFPDVNPYEVLGEP